MVLVISAAKASVIQIHTMDHLSSCSGAGKAWTVAAITPAAAGVGIPMKYFEPPGAMPCTLKRASRQAQQTTNAKQNHHPKCPICCAWRLARFNEIGRAHV